MPANPHVGRTRPTNAWAGQLVFPSEGYVPDHVELPWYDVHGRKAAAQGRKELYRLRLPGKFDCSGNRVDGDAWQQAKAFVQREILSKPNTLTPRQVWDLVDKAERAFATRSTRST